MSPLEIFRRNQKVMMTGLILLAMFAFVVLPAVSEYMVRSGGPGMSDPVLAEYSGVSLTASRVQQFTRQHNETVRYLVRLAQEVINRGAEPQVPGFFADQRTGDIQQVGINMSPSDDMSIKTLQFAAAAQDLGFDLDDTALELWLEQFTGGVISQREMFALLRKQSENRLGQFQLFDMLRKQLLSQIYLQSAASTVARGQFPLQSPLDHWRNFLQLNQNATIDAYGVLVNDFMDETEASPLDSQIEAVFEAGKDRFPSEMSPEPGFRRFDTASFEYLVADLQKFREAMIAELSEEEIEAEYEKQKAGGAFQLPPELDLKPEDPPADMPTGDTPEESAGEEAEMDPAADETETKPADADDNASNPDLSPASDAEKTEAFAKELEEASKLIDPEPAKEDDQANATANPSNAVQLVAFQDESAQATENSSEQAEEASPPTEESASGDEASDTSSDSEAAAEPPAQPAADGEEPADDADAPEPRYRTLEEVRDEVTQSMVAQDAGTAATEAISKAEGIMKSYFTQRALSEGSETAETPERPDLEALAEELGLEYRKIGPHTPVSIQDEPIASSVDPNSVNTQQRIPFAALMYGVPNQFAAQVEFRPIKTIDIMSESLFVSWKTDFEEEYTPKLDDVRDEVIEAIRKAEAIGLATKAAEDLAEQANNGKSLEELVPEDRKDQLFEDLGPFKWKMVQGFGNTMVGNVPELDNVGERFMKAVFEGKEGSFVVAPSESGRVVYVVKVDSLLPKKADLQAIFSQRSERFLSTFMSDGTATKVQSGFFKRVDDETGFTRYEYGE
ncbi:MAG: hypothetical protein AAF802_04435 [Planctomycetota bacterium]